MMEHENERMNYSFEPQPEEKDKIFEKEIFIFENKWKKPVLPLL